MESGTLCTYLCCHKFGCSAEYEPAIKFIKRCELYSSSTHPHSLFGAFGKSLLILLHHATPDHHPRTTMEVELNGGLCGLLYSECSGSSYRLEPRLLVVSHYYYFYYYYYYYVAQNICIVVVQAPPGGAVSPVSHHVCRFIITSVIIINIIWWWTVGRWYIHQASSHVHRKSFSQPAASQRARMDGWMQRREFY